MKNVVFAVVACLMTSSAFAEVKSGPMDLSEASLVNGVFTFAYRMGGGCADHTPLVSVKLTANAKKDLESVELIVQDVASELDACEAYIGASGEAKVADLVTAAAKAAGIKVGYMYTVKMPKVEMTSN